jgi:type I restriction enzyme S subunit
MLKLSFPTRKLKGSLILISGRYKDCSDNDLTVYGVTNKEGIVVTGKDVSDDTSNYIVVRGQSFVYNPYRINVGSIGLSDGDFKGIVSPAYVAFKTKDDINPEFLFLYLKSSLGNNLIKWYGDRGGVRSALRFNDLEKIDFPDLTYKQQTSALIKIKEFMNINQSFYAETEQQGNYIKELRQSILQHAVQGKLVPQDSNDEPASELLKRIKAEKDKLIKEGKLKKEKPLSPISKNEIPYEIPQSWKWTRLGDIGSSNIGLTYQPMDISDNKGIPVLRSNNIKNNKIDLNNLVKVTTKINSENLYLKNGDILICARNGSQSLIGKSAIIEDITEKISFGAFMAVFRSSLNKWVKVYLDAPLFKNTLSSVNTVTINQITQSNLKNAMIPLPPLVEQKRIVNKVDELMKICDELETENKNSQTSAQQLLQAILQQSFMPSEKLSETAADIIPNNNVIDITAAINKRAVLNAYIIDKMRNNKQFGAIMDEKLIYLIEKIVQLPINGRYEKAAAGPLDSDARQKVKEIFKELKWFKITEGNENQAEQYEEDVSVNDYKLLFEQCFADKKDEINRLLNLFKYKDLQRCEAVATLYAVWNDLLIDNADCSEENIINGFYEWSERKSSFNRSDLLDELAWMKHQNLNPTGKGEKTIVKPKQEKLLRT